jgi:hypothetical protein
VVAQTTATATLISLAALMVMVVCLLWVIGEVLLFTIGRLFSVGLPFWVAPIVPIVLALAVVRVVSVVGRLLTTAAKSAVTMELARKVFAALVAVNGSKRVTHGLACVVPLIVFAPARVLDRDVIYECLCVMHAEQPTHSMIVMARECIF